MKATILRVTSVLALLLAVTAVSAHAQTVIKAQKFTVPFDFKIGEKELPAGEYSVYAEDHAIRVQNTDGKGTAIALSKRYINARRKGVEVKLRFRQYGNLYYLSQVWLADGLGRELPNSRSEYSDIAQTFNVVEVAARKR